MGITLCKGSSLCLGAEHQAPSPLQYLGWAFLLQVARDRKILQWEEEKEMLLVGSDLITTMEAS